MRSLKVAHEANHHLSPFPLNTAPEIPAKARVQENEIKYMRQNIQNTFSADVLTVLVGKAKD